jgi:hypothetical protein
MGIRQQLDRVEFLYLDFGSFDYISPWPTFGTLQNGVIDGRVWHTKIDAKNTSRESVSTICSTSGPRLWLR